MGNYLRASHTQQGVTYRLNTECDVLRKGDREIPQKSKKPKVWETCVLAQSLP